MKKLLVLLLVLITMLTSACSGSWEQTLCASGLYGLF